MRILFFSFVLFFFSKPLFAQIYSDESIAYMDSLQQLINTLGENNLEVADLYIKLGDTYFESAHYEKAAETYNKALTIKRNLLDEEHLAVADVYFKVGKAEFEFDNDSLANKLFIKVLDIRLKKLDKDHLKVAECYNELGLTYAFLGDYEKSDSLINKGLHIRLDKLGENNLEVADSYDYLGMLFTTKSEFGKSINFLNKALNIRQAKSNQNQLEIAVSYIRLGSTYTNKHELEKSIKLYQKALNIRIEKLGENHLKVAKLYFFLAKANMYSEKYEQSILLYEKALKIELKRRKENSTYFAKIYYSMAISFNYMGKKNDAIEYNDKALKIWREELGENHTQVAKAYLILGIINNNINAYEKAIKFTKKALKIWNKNFDTNYIEIATCYNNLSGNYDAIGDYEHSIILNKMALKIWIEKSDKNHPNIAAFYNSLGSKFRDIGNYQKSMESSKEAKEILEKIYGEKDYHLASVYASLGLTNAKLGNYNLAIEQGEKAIALWIEKFGENEIRTHQYYHALAMIYFQSSNYQESIFYTEKSLENIYQHYETDQYLGFQKYNFLINAYKNIGDFEKVDSLVQVSIPQSFSDMKNKFLYLHNEQRVKFIDIIQNYYKSCYAYACTNPNPPTTELATNLLINTKALALDYSTSVNQIINEIDDEKLNILNDSLTTIKHKIDKAEQLNEDDKERVNMDSLRINRDNVASEILAHPTIKKRLNFDKIEWQQVQEKLQANEVMLDCVNFYSEEDSTEMYYAMLIGKNSENPQFIKLTNSDELLPYFKSSSKDAPPKFVENKEDRKALYQLIWQPLQSHLEGINTVHLSPVGLLHKVDYAILQNEANEYLADKYQFYYYTTTRDFVNKTTTTKQYKNALLLGHILFDVEDKQTFEEEEALFDDLALNRTVRNNIKPLPGTLEEVKKIGVLCDKANINATTLTIDAASEDTVSYFVGNRSPSIYHFATHGVFIEPSDTLNKKHSNLEHQISLIDNPLQRSVLMLSGANHTWTNRERYLGSNKDGILTAAEVANLNLSHTKLVVLSACNTGLGSIHNTEGVFGLQRAFKLAGVDNVLVSLWPVNDEITKELMILFYENLLQHKQEAATALRNAKAAMRKLNDIPRFWAGFVLVE